MISSVGHRGATIAGILNKCCPIIMKIEADQDFGAAPYHNTDGPIPVRRYPREEWLPTQAAFYEACRLAGYDDCPDHNAPHTSGVGPYPLNNQDGIRLSTAITYLSQARERANLTILANTTAARILLDGTRATGVAMLLNGQGSRSQWWRNRGEWRCHRFPPTAYAFGHWASRSAGGFRHSFGPRCAGRGGQNLREHPAVQMQWRLQDDYLPEPVRHWLQVGIAVYCNRIRSRQ